MSHMHFCDVAGHEWHCADPNCTCICGMPMEEGDHSGCPIALVGCPEHVAEQESEHTPADSEFYAKLKRSYEMQDGPERDALLHEIVMSIFPGVDSGDNH